VKAKWFILAFAASVIAAAATQVSLASLGGTREDAKPLQESRSDDSRLFLSTEQSERAAAERLVPDGTRSVLNLRKRLRYGQFVWDDKDVGEGPLNIRVDLDHQLISAFRGGHEVGTAVILYGGQGHDTPLGRFPVLAKLERHRSATYDAPMPFTLRLTGDGVAIHGSDVRWGTATHGCIGVPLEFARRLFAEASVGDKVEIVGGEETRRPSPNGRALSTIS